MVGGDGVFRAVVVVVAGKMGQSRVELEMGRALGRAALLVLGRHYRFRQSTSVLSRRRHMAVTLSRRRLRQTAVILSRRGLRQLAVILCRGRLRLMANISG